MNRRSFSAVARVRAALLFAAIAVSPVAARAQQPIGTDAATLTGVSAHLDAARFDSARAVLGRWRTAHGATAPESERARADMLAARLERDGDAARHAWLGLALAHPFGPDAGLALLRVGQAALLQGDTAAAAVYLNRLIDDFPGSGHQAEARLWLSRAHFLGGRARVACDVARAGLATAGSAEVQGLLRIQEERVCAAASATPDAAPARLPAPPEAEPGGRFAVQSGAFRSRSGADALAGRLRRAGLEPRLVRVPGSELLRVRVGSFTDQSAALRLRDRVRDAGMEAVVVGDANRETTVP